MATFDAKRALPDGSPGAWGAPVEMSYDRRDVLLYAVGIGSTDLRHVYEGDPRFSVFPTFPIRWGGAGARVDEALVPRSPGPLNIDAERYLEVLEPMPVDAVVQAVSRLVAVHPRGRGNALVEYETEIAGEDGRVYARMRNGSFRRGVQSLGDIEPFEGSGQTFFQKIERPERQPDMVVRNIIATGQAHLYRLSGDYNALHIDPAAARFGGFDRPILHGLCTFGICARLLTEAFCGGEAERFRRIKVRFSAPVYPGEELCCLAWSVVPGHVVFEAHASDRAVVSSAFFEFDEPAREHAR